LTEAQTARASSVFASVIANHILPGAALTYGRAASLGASDLPDSVRNAACVAMSHC
jgi:hypothetical protein